MATDKLTKRTTDIQPVDTNSAIVKPAIAKKPFLVKLTSEEIKAKRVAAYKYLFP